MSCAPLQGYEGQYDWTSESVPSAPTPDVDNAEAAVTAASISSDLERAYRAMLREYGLSSSEDASLFGHMRAIGLLPPAQ